ncbi:MAG: YetF domain-containing protein [Pseudomonadota bacterium]
MNWLPDAWSDLFAVETPVLELVVRGTILYFTILVLMRFMPRRTGGELATMDLIFLLLIAEAASNAFGEYTSVSEGLVLVVVLMGWNFIINAASYRFRFVEKLVSSPPIQVIRDGRMLRRNMRREFLTEEELMSSLRQQSIASVDEVKAAYIEGEGALTVVRFKES